MGESRQELISWMNDLLQLSLTRVEQCGTGAPLCQIFDSIYGDVPMTKVKFNVNSEYQYIGNFKVLQAVFLHHKIEKTIPVERLTKCKFQDNLEFLQWVKKFWDQFYPGGDYDPVARRKGQGMTSSAPAAPAAARAPSVVSSRKASSGAPPVTGIAPRNRTPSTGVQVAQLQAESAALREQAEGLERERDFYFNKLREIEILVQAVADEDAALAESGQPANAEKDLLIKQIQDILYTTEEGFEIPDQADGVPDDEETF
ncbi:calponin homology domain-containing protein [Lipomyces tetrasporus]|uniref:Calponin homology domain-containing protein n=1 Tax=Lipomyces tetrasporus TaxID=54092 RepID=A0AAD7QPC9_9ASCO|nr:calponin homology domain-containing protein [Lipomyces tetrasporus]KAJ8098836.1 calponin homology domain-containing protein [Lipomyces tetrasporus]